MEKWMSLTEERRKQIIQQTSAETGLPEPAVEKDLWVTCTLKAIFTTQYKESIVFKGGTSLSKGWDLIKRFSEDVDLGINKDILGEKYHGDLSRTKIGSLRAASARFICNEFKQAIKESLYEIGIPNTEFELVAPNLEENHSDPIQLELKYKSVLQQGDGKYLQPRVLIEGSSRSGGEPSTFRLITSFIYDSFSTQDFSFPPFEVPVIEPRRTFLEKAFLLHELFQKGEKKSLRLSRHLYDLERIMDTEHGRTAITDKELYQSIIQHREQYNKIKGVDYNTHQPATISFIPPKEELLDWEEDYNKMREEMFYGETLDFSRLMDRMAELQRRFRNI